MTEVIILTGPSRAGKSTVCSAVIADARARGLTVAGILTDDEARPDGSRVQVAVDLRTGERRTLAVARGAATLGGTESSASTTAYLDPLSGVPRGGWIFDDEGVAFGGRVLKACLTESCDLLVVDQIGPLELLVGRGWRVAFAVLARQRFGLALLVVNPRVLEQAQALIGPCRILPVEQPTRDALPAAIIAKHLPPAAAGI